MCDVSGLCVSDCVIENFLLCFHRYDLMLLCWRHNPSHRPTFISIIERLVPELSERFRMVSYYYGRNSTAELAKDRIDEEHTVVARSNERRDRDNKVVPTDVNVNLPTVMSSRQRSTGLAETNTGKELQGVHKEPAKPGLLEERFACDGQSAYMQGPEKDETSLLLRDWTANPTVLAESHFQSDSRHKGDYSGSGCKNGGSNSLSSQRNGLKNGRVVPPANLLATSAC
jgi:hypothetical protein